MLSFQLEQILFLGSKSSSRADHAVVFNSAPGRKKIKPSTGMQREGKKQTNIATIQWQTCKHTCANTHIYRLPSHKHSSLQVLQRPRDVRPPQQAAHCWKDDEQHKWVKSKLCNLTVGTVMKQAWSLRSSCEGSPLCDPLTLLWQASQCLTLLMYEHGTILEASLLGRPRGRGCGF